MTKKMLIDATHAEETRVVVVDGNKVEEFDFETVNKRQLAGNIYLAKVTRVEPSLQAAFVDYGGNRHGFLAFAEIHPDYYQIPVADRQALIAEERALAEQQEADEARRGRRRSKAAGVEGDGDAIAQSETDAEPLGMDVVDLGEPMEADLYVAPDRTEDETVYAAVDSASETDSDIESIAEEDVSEELPPPPKQRARRYKIQEVIKVRQIMLVQVVKEERGNKGAALTTYLSLPGRYCVLMPNTARGGGISRKITNAADRKKLKEIASELEVPEGAGLIIRTAGAQRTKSEIKRDYEYLMRLWEQIRDLTLKSIAPAPIYEEGNLIKRAIRDLYESGIEEVLVEGDAGYRTALDFMKMIMPPDAVKVIRYHDTMPLFARYQVESYLSGMFNPVVQLKSGGYIVIGVTEALVAIDVNSGRATKEGSIEDTALKTNLEAADEISRQLRLRDLAGLIVIDFIDMEERRNNASVEKRLKEKLKTDRARIQVGRISGFGLMEMSRQRLRPGMIEATTAPCQHCHGTGLVRSDDSLALAILRQIEEEGTRKRCREVVLKAPVGVVNFLVNQKREHIAQIEARYGLSVRIEADPFMISPDFSIEKLKTATRALPEAQTAVISLDTTEAMPEYEEEVVKVEEAPVSAATPVAEEPREEGEGPARKKKRRRRRRRNGQNGDANVTAQDADADGDEGDDEAPEAEVESVTAEPAAEEVPAVIAPEPVVAPVETEAPKLEVAAVAIEAVAETVTAEEAPAVEAPAEAEPPKKKPRTRRKKVEPVAEAAEAPAEVEAPKKKPRTRRKKVETPVEAVTTEIAPEATPVSEATLPADLQTAEPGPVAPVSEATAPAPAEEETVTAEPALADGDEAEKPASKRRGWWTVNT
ncbi:ribonuclease [Haematobacter massiliensis]|uniref:Ribonuclease E n=2 Tax=Haematobacter massiliensis TaxID=195105 RepID=A0A086YBU6_9RHOB|nr:ribonuclease E/G [Haematobacter massiliensis]KFI31746.1 ribonuclease [Haematobacter massiliensis]OWJ87702.1 ribonuclease E/G [Haematobacter massiliensis]QBJ24138.1 ribonuclease E/G [Haematobacter massiliensis]